MGQRGWHCHCKTDIKNDVKRGLGDGPEAHTNHSTFRVVEWSMQCDKCGHLAFATVGEKCIKCNKGHLKAI